MGFSFWHKGLGFGFMVSWDIDSGWGFVGCKLKVGITRWRFRIEPHSDMGYEFGI